MSYWVVKDRDGYLREYELKIEPYFSGDRGPVNVASVPPYPEVTHDRLEAARFSSKALAEAVACLLRVMDHEEEGEWRAVRVRPKAKGE